MINYLEQTKDYYEINKYVGTRSVLTRFRVRNFKFVLRNAALVQSPVREDFLVSVWDWCQPSIVRNSDNPGPADHMSLVKWLDNLSPLSANK